MLVRHYTFHDLLVYLVGRFLFDLCLVWPINFIKKNWGRAQYYWRIAIYLGKLNWKHSLLGIKRDASRCSVLFDGYCLVCKLILRCHHFAKLPYRCYFIVIWERNEQQGNQKIRRHFKSEQRGLHVLWVYWYQIFSWCHQNEMWKPTLAINQIWGFSLRRNRRMGRFCQDHENLRVKAIQSEQWINV